MALIEGTSGNNHLRGTDSADEIYGYGGNDEIEGRSGSDTLYGGSGHDELDGDKGNDTFYGAAGNDELDGDGGKDELRGGKGNDHLDGGNGNDTLTGGKGADVFEFETGDGRDVLADWGRGDDRMDLDDLGYSSFGQVMQDASNVGGDVVFEFRGGTEVTVLDAHTSDFSAGDFILF